MLNKHTVIRNSGIVQSLNFVDLYRLLLSHDCVYRVHVERRETYGAISECYLYEGTDLEAANRVYARYVK